MTSTCSAFDAKNRLGRLLDRVQAGEEVVITRHGHPVAKLVPAIRSDAESVNATLATFKQIRGMIAHQGIKISRKEVLQWTCEGRK